MPPSQPRLPSEAPARASSISGEVDRVRREMVNAEYRAARRAARYWDAVIERSIAAGRTAGRRKPTAP